MKLLYFLVFILLPYTTNSVKLNENEHIILVKIKHQWLTIQSVQLWDDRITHCSWPGIQCTNDSVTGISLPNQNIAGMIPTSICELTNLVTLNLSSNFVTSFPTFLSNCSKLQTLDLFNNKITGRLPTDMHKFSNLKHFDVSINRFSGAIPSEVGQLSKLTTLYMYENQFSGNIPESFANLSSLEKLQLSDNYLVGRIPSRIFEKKKLILLYLYKNQLSGEIPKSVDSVNLLEIDLSKNNLTGTLPFEFGKFKKLEVLYLNNNQLSGEIPGSFGNLSSLTGFGLKQNKLVGSIPSGLFLLKKLTYVYLNENQLLGEIPKSIDALNLVEIDFSTNYLTGRLPEQFGKLQKLEMLCLYKNRLSGPIPKSFINLSSLEYLSLQMNKLSGAVPSQLFQLENLTHIFLLRNSLSGALPRYVGIHSKLVVFDINQNQFSGALPEDMCLGGSLTHLLASTNNFSGQIPESLTRCNSLQLLQLDFNGFSGEVPYGIWMLKNLSSLNLENNQLSGMLPCQWSEELVTIYISQNQFSGLIPSGVGNSTNLVTFRSSNNQLQGLIPLELTALSKLNNLQLDGNQLFGELPSTIVSWKSLATLNLSRNKLFGPIPAGLGFLGSLRYLDLSHNELSGQIPSELGKLILSKLDLSSNSLRGKVPSAFDNLVFVDSFANNSNMCSNTHILKIPKCSPSSWHKHLTAILASGGVFSISVICFSFLMIKHCLGRKREHNSEELSWELIAFHKLGFTESDIESGLVEENTIGAGGAGKVYCINLNKLGSNVVAKKIWNHRKLGQDLERQFLAEVKILGSIRHANIIKLLCCMSSEQTKLLIYEYMENQSLDKWLPREHTKHESSISPQTSLNWPTRLKIAVGAAKGLSYMHHGCSPAIIHRDVKSSNILLDSEFNAKVADFGLAKISTNKGGDPHTASVIAGSIGYIAPEYMRTRRLNEKIDVYSFGVVLLELSTGKEAHKGNDYLNLADWSRQHYEKGYPIRDALDVQILNTPQYMEEITNVFKLGIMCTHVIPSGRPSMKQVVELLISFGQTRDPDSTPHDENGEQGT